MTGDPWLDGIIKVIRDHDASRPRSRQAEPGWSEVGGCRAYLGYRLSGAWATDDPDNWAAIRGTALHQYLESVLGPMPGMRAEVTVSYRGIPGHADLLQVTPDTVVDWKSAPLAKIRTWQADPRALHSKRVQAHGYAAGLIDAGELPEDAAVRIVGIPVDGKFSDWWAFSEPFDRTLADWGADRRDQVAAMLAEGEELPKDEPYAFCSSWCRFFSLCRAGDSPSAEEEITDPELATAVAAYGEAHERETAAKDDKKRLAPMLRGLHGTAGGWRVSMTRQGEPSPALDEDAVYAEYASRGQLPPMTAKDGAPAKLSVRKVKGAAA